MLVIGLGFLAAAYFSYVDQNTGPEAMAKVLSCSGSYGRYSSGVTCQATWVTGGSLVGGNGHVMVGDLEAADYSDVGHTISVHLHGGTAYPTKDSLRLPIVFLVFALPSLYVAIRVLLFGVPESWRGRRRSRPSGVSP